MSKALLQWNPYLSPLSLSIKTPQPQTRTKTFISATLQSINNEELTAKERRHLRNERRESKTTNWREEVEERLLVKPKKRYASWTEELNLDNLALLGPQWWVVRVSRVLGQDTAERLARSLVREYPNIEFKVYAPAIQVKRKLKNGTISVKLKPIFPGCAFLRCVLNKELHDFIRECDGVGGFIGSKVGNTKRQINRPKPVSENDMEAVFRQAKEEQERTDQTFKEEQQKEAAICKDKELNSATDVADVKPKRKTQKGSETILNTTTEAADKKLLTPGSGVRALSGPFMEFTGNLKKLNRKTGKATVGFMLFGKESFVELDVTQIVAETT